MTPYYSELFPFTQIAKNKYPNLPLHMGLNYIYEEFVRQNERLVNVENEIDSVNLEASRSQFRTYKYYNWEGIYIETGPNGNVKTMDGTTSIFVKIINLYDHKKYDELQKLCEETIKKKSNWYTPYIYLASICLLKGEIAKAENLVEIVIEKAIDETSVTNARNIKQEILKLKMRRENE